MSATMIRVRTAARYQGLAVTVLGDTQAGLLAVAGYGTPQELAIAAIVVKDQGGHRLYRVTGTRVWTASIDDVAQAAVNARKARDPGT